MNTFKALVIATAFLLSSCGGGGGGGGSGSTVQPVYSGTVAVGAAVTGVDVTGKCADGKTYSTKSDNSGKYSLGAGISPCSFEVKIGQNLVMQSMSIAPGVVNVTPLTDLGVKWAKADPNKLQTTKQAMLTSLPNWGIPLSEDPFTTSFNADGTGHDKVIEQYVAMANTVPLTSAGSQFSVINLNQSIATQCEGKSECYPLESVFQLIQDETVKEFAKVLLEKIDKAGGLFASAGLEDAEKIYIERGFQYISGLILKQATPYLKRGLLKASVGNPNAVRQIATTVADDLILDASVNFKDVVLKIKKLGTSKVQFALDVGSDFLINRLENRLVDWVNDGSSEYIPIKSIGFAASMFAVNSAAKIAVGCYPWLDGSCVNPRKLQSLFIQAEVEFMLNYIVEDAAMLYDIIKLKRDLADSIRHVNVVDLLAIDYSLAKDASVSALSAWLNSNMTMEYLPPGFIDKAIGNVDFSVSMEIDAAIQEELKRNQLLRLVKLKDKFQDIKSLCQTVGVQSCKATLENKDIPTKVLSFYATQSAPGQPIEGVVYIQGASLSMNRIHAGVALNDSYCYIDLPKDKFSSSFNFSGGWVNENSENSKVCSQLLPTKSGETKSITFKMEVRDSAGNLADGGVIKSVVVSYKSKSTPIIISGVNSTNSSFNASVTPRVGQQAYFQVTGSNLPSTLALAVADCANMSVIFNSTTEVRFQCLPSGSGSTKSITVKDQPGGSALYNSSVYVQ